MTPGGGPAGSPPAHVLDLFAVPDAVQPLPGGQGASVRAGDLVLSPGRDAEVLAWLAPVLARTAVRLDEARLRAGARSDLRVAMPVPARDGSWVVDGWAASRFEPGTRTCTDLGVTLAAGRLFAAELAAAVPARPPGLDRRDDRWATAERAAFGDPSGPAVPSGPAEPVGGRAPRDVNPADGEPTLGEHPDALVRALAAARDDTPLGPDGLVHADLWGNVLLDGAGAAVVIDVAPAWRPALWAEAVCVLDAWLWGDAAARSAAEGDGVAADGSAEGAVQRPPWSTGARRQAMIRAALFRMLSDRPAPTPDYADALAALLGPL